ncbi:MAG: M20/M25/M40 family metallo-hydrolase, partial [Acidimicrobiia bacterium]|nr:M20/M25/M40 family metallo-hydrolase [Acidimicrobiia bacterium]
MHATADRLADWVSRLVQIPSVNPLHEGPSCGKPGEEAIAEAVGSYFGELGAREVEVVAVDPGRPNVYGIFTGRTDRLVVLDVHTDTVTVENMIEDPFDGRIEDGRVWGRGAVDTKASLGVICGLLEAWKAEGLRPQPTLLVVGTASEEAGGLLGAVRFREWAERRELDIDQMVVAEPTKCAPIYGHKGGVALEITIKGQSAHTGTPHLGRNAITAAAHVLLALDRHHQDLIAEPPKTEVGTGTLTTTMIDGGIAQNVVPDRCTIKVGRRIAPFEDPAVEYERIAAIVREACPLPVDVAPIIHFDVGTGPGSPAF